MTHRIPRRAFALCLLLPVMAHAQAPLPDVSPQYVVTYIEAAPAKADAVAGLLRTYRDGAKPGAIRIDALRRNDVPHHFAIVGQWRDTAAFKTDADASHTRAFRAALAPHLVAPYDERRHHGLNTADPADAPAAALVSVTHVDIVPTEREPGIASVGALATASRGTPGNLRYDALIQSTRPNHATLVETWRDRDAHNQHVVSSHLRSFRDALLPRSGSLYDERHYTVLD